MKIKDVTGIDVSKLKLDCYIHNKGVQSVFGNSPESITAMLAWSLDTSGVPRDELLFVFEHTGGHAHQLIGQLACNGFHFHLVAGLEIKRSMGIARGKDDKSDARRIALYGYSTREEKRPVQVPPGVLEKVKRLMSLRKKLVAERAGHITTRGEQQRIFSEGNNALLFGVLRELILTYDGLIAKIEKEIGQIIET